MKEFYDNDCKLTFRCYSGNESTYSHFSDEYVNYIYQMNMWKDEGIDKFLVSSTPLGNFFNWNNSYFSRDEKNNSELVLGFDLDQLIGCALVTIKNPSIAHQLKYFNKNLLPVLADNNPLINIEFIATDPKLRGLGYGARLIKGIKNNEKILTDDMESSGITAHVRNNNIPSQKAFLKNKFVIVNKGHLLRPTQLYYMLYSGKYAETLEKE